MIVRGRAHHQRIRSDFTVGVESDRSLTRVELLRRIQEQIEAAPGIFRFPVDRIEIEAAFANEGKALVVPGGVHPDAPAL